ncbi:MAG: MerR family transcriptional regulator [Candidatus Omnitrophica bacterium]|nr:MerR family transcriptional regulator [Candidatus Omnitrophota bacterium]
MNGRLTITDVAERIGVTPKTLVRWEKSGKIRKPKRDWKGWRFYSEDEVVDIERFVNMVYEL